MPKNKVTDLITDQEMAFALLVISGKMTDQQAAEAVGLNPNTAAYTKSKPRVRDYMLEHRARMQQQLAAQQTEELRRQNLSREQVLARLWEIANLSPEMTRNSITSQVKALSMIIAIEGLIPDRRAGSAQNKPAPPPPTPQIYAGAWLNTKKEQTAGPEDNPVEEGLGIPPVEPAAGAPPDRGQGPGLKPGLNPGDPFNPGQSTFPNPFSLSETQSPTSAAFAPDTSVPISLKESPYAPYR